MQSNSSSTETSEKMWHFHRDIKPDYMLSIRTCPPQHSNNGASSASKTGRMDAMNFSGKTHPNITFIGEEDEKDKRIRELSAELQRTKQQLAKCQKQLVAVLNDVELHMDHLTRIVQHIVQNVKTDEEHPSRS